MGAPRDNKKTDQKRTAKLLLGIVDAIAKSHKLKILTTEVTDTTSKKLLKQYSVLSEFLYG